MKDQPAAEQQQPLLEGGKTGESMPGGPLHDAPRPSTTAKLLACLSYGAVSVSITLFNKAVFSYYKFNYPSFVTTLQIVVSLLYMFILRRVQLLDFEDFDFKTARQVFPLALFWWLYVVSGVSALRYLNVPMYSVLRRATTLFVVAGEFVMFQRAPSALGLGAICLMVAGAVVAGTTDLTYSLPGYLWVTVCVVSTAVYLLLIKALKDRTTLSQASMLFYNNALALPLMAGWMFLATDELATVGSYPLKGDLRFQLFLLVSVSQAFLLNLCIFRCTTINSPLATTITGQMKDILTTGLGMVLFADVQFNFTNLLGVAIGLAGGITYGALGYMEQQRQQRKQLPRVHLKRQPSGGATAYRV